MQARLAQLRVLDYAPVMPPPSHLDNPETARLAWARFRRLIRGMIVAAVVVTVVSLAVLRLRNPDAGIHMFIASALGVFLSVVLSSVLMGLVFLSAGTGHDDAIEDPLSRELDDD